ncbi:alpha/beta hydrolase [Corynebacterium sp. 35RC1]|nr:alpha/beta hydrolase [Corynebacterium sp. 35RC1]
MQMFIQRDEFSGRPVAEDAYPALKGFRDAGNPYFHSREISELREFYVESSNANGLKEDENPQEKDFSIGDFGVRLYRANAAVAEGAQTPVIVFFHGGGWVMGNLETHQSVARRLANSTGLPVFAVDYRLAPEHRYPAAIDDCRKAVEWIVESTEHGISVDGLIAVGDSAGGQLAASITNEVVDGQLPGNIIAQVLLYPVTDVSDLNLDGSSSYKRIKEGFPLIDETMRWFIDSYIDEGEIRKNPDVSPAYAEFETPRPPSFVLTVDNDPLCDEGAAYVLKLAQAGTRVHYDHLSGYAHGIFTSAGVIEQGEKSLKDVVEFIKRQL